MRMAQRLMGIQQEIATVHAKLVDLIPSEDRVVEQLLYGARSALREAVQCLSLAEKVVKNRKGKKI
jgi:DNA-binding FadR family transcriptional regulator